MNRPVLMLCATVVVWFNSSLAPAAISNYEFKSNEPPLLPSFVYTGGDLLVIAIGAQLSGQVSIATDENTGAAELRFGNLLIHSAFDGGQPTNRFQVPEDWTPEFYEGKMLTELDAFDASIQGQRISPTEIKFGPSISVSPYWHEQYFTFTVDTNSYHLSGGSFHSDDSPNFYIDGQLIPIPEPSTSVCLITGVACLANWRRRA